MEEKMRLQKYLASCGIASRRKCEEIILQGKVKVNNQIVTELGTKIDPKKDKVEYEGKELKENTSHVYILLNKPIDYVTTVKDQFGRNSILDLIKINNRRIVPVGRLDMYTSGAILLTDDGDFVYKITHPKHEISKVYTVTIKGIPTKEEIAKLESGIDIGGFITHPAKVRIIKTDNEKNISRLEITIHEGKNRQIRRMCDAINKKVLALHRAKIGNISVKDLKIGTWRYLTRKEVEELQK